MAIEAVLFDLGETLVHYDAPDIDGLFRRGAQLTYDFLGKLVASAAKLPRFQYYYRKNIISIKLHYFWSCITSREFDCLALLDRKASDLGFRLSREELEELAWLWYKPLADSASVEPNLHQHLSNLQEMSIKLALISNTFLPPVVMDRHLRQLNLLSFFPIRRYSSATIIRKPHRRIYQDTLSELNVPPGRAVMVGDKLREDINGPRKVGMKAVLKRGPGNRTKKIDNSIPQIDSIAELIDLIGRWQKED